MSVIMDVLPLVVSIIMGAWTTYKKQEAQDLHAERLYAIDSTKAARQDQHRDTSFSRKFIVQSVIGSLFLFPMLLTFLNWLGRIWSWEQVAIYVPKELVYKGLFTWIWSVQGQIEYIPIYGFVLMPIHILLAQVICGYYFGASTMRR